MKQASSQDTHDSLGTMYMKKAAERLYKWSNYINSHVLIPVGDLVKDGFSNYPLLASYLMVMMGLSIVPILSFIGFSFFVGSILVGTGVLYVMTWGSIIIGSAFFALLITLASLLAVAAWIVIGSLLTIFAVKTMFDLQNAVVHKIKHGHISKNLSDYSAEKRSQQQENPVKNEL